MSAIDQSMVNFALGESAISAMEQRFESWCNKVSLALGHKVDPDGIAHDFFCDGRSEEEAVKEFNSFSDIGFKSATVGKLEGSLK